MQKHLKHADGPEARRHISSLHGGGVDAALTPVSWMGQGGSASIHKGGRSVVNTTVGLDLAKNVFQAFGLTPPGAMWPR